MSEQENAFRKLSRLKVGALFMEMGTGKTKVALDLIASKSHKIDYVLWVCPYSLKDEIEAERQKWHPELAIDIVGCESIGASNRIYMQTLKKVSDSKTFMVVDESLKIKSIYAKRTKRIITIGDNAVYKLILNGTPVTRNILDLWTQMEFLSPKILGMSYNEFKNNYCEYYQTGKLKGMVKRQHNIPHLIAKIEPYIFDCRLDINTKKTYNEIRYMVSSKKEYELYKERLYLEYANGNEDDFNFNAFAMRLQRWYACNSDRGETIQSITERIQDKVIIFVKYLDGIPYGSHSITGDKSSSERKLIIEDFKNGLFDVLYITYGCGAFGLNLQFCQHMIFADKTWDYAQKIQAEARIYRMGQKENVTYYDLKCDGIGLEDMMDRCISKKVSLLYEMKIELERTKKGVKEWLKSI